MVSLSFPALLASLTDCAALNYFKAKIENTQLLVTGDHFSWHTKPRMVEYHHHHHHHHYRYQAGRDTRSKIFTTTKRRIHYVLLDSWVLRRNSLGPSCYFTFISTTKLYHKVVLSLPTVVLLKLARCNYNLVLVCNCWSVLPTHQLKWNLLFFFFFSSSHKYWSVTKPLIFQSVHHHCNEMAEQILLDLTNQIKCMPPLVLNFFNPWKICHNKNWSFATSLVGYPVALFMPIEMQKLVDSHYCNTQKNSQKMNSGPAVTHFQAWCVIIGENLRDFIRN